MSHLRLSQHPPIQLPGRDGAGLTNWQSRPDRLAETVARPRRKSQNPACFARVAVAFNLLPSMADAC
jgi:hypothetical protein